MPDENASPFLPADGPPSVVRSLGDGMLVDEDDAVTNWVTPRPGLADALGNLRLGVITFVADGAGGLAGGLVARDGTWVVTTDLDVRLVRPVRDERVRIVGRGLRAGATTVVCSLDIVDDASGRPLGTGSITNHVLETPNPPSRDVWPRGHVMGRTGAPDARPVAEVLAIAPAGEGAVELPLTPDVRNPWGIMHGGVVAVGAEEAVLRHPAATGRPPLGMLVRYLSPTRTGPARFVAQFVGGSDATAVFTVRAHDVGAGDRVTALATVTLGPR